MRSSVIYRHAESRLRAFFIGVMLLVVYTTFAMTLYLLPPSSLVAPVAVTGTM